MSPFLSLGIIGLWLLYSIIIKLTKKRKYDYTYIVAFVFLFGYLYFYFVYGMEGLYYDVFTYTTIGVFGVWIIGDNSLLLFRKNVSEFDFHSLEQELEHVSDASELLRRRFISTIELLHDGISFRDSEFIFGSDKYIEILGITSNEFTVENFEERIVKEDLVQYKMILEKLSKKYPKYSIKYRVRNGNKNTWIFEQGKLVIIHKKRTYISLVKRMDIRLYPESDVDVLNSLPNESQLHDVMQQLHRKKHAYHLVIIQLTNIPMMNEKYGRDYGDLVMGEYLSKLRFKFIKDTQSLFRISGIKFALLIKEKSKFALLDRALVGQGELFNMTLKFGGISQTLYPNLGIAEAPYEGKNASLVFKEASKALAMTLSDDYNQTYCFYED